MRHVTAFKELVLPGVLGECTIVQSVSFHISARLLLPANPTALHAVWLKQSTLPNPLLSLAEVFGLGTRVHDEPFQLSISVCSAPDCGPK